MSMKDIRINVSCDQSQKLTFAHRGGGGGSGEGLNLLTRYLNSPLDMPQNTSHNKRLSLFFSLEIQHREIVPSQINEDVV